MSKAGKSSPRRNWYKVATLALSAAMVGIMFVSGIYYKRIENRADRLDAVQEKIGKFLEQRARIAEFPKVEVSLLTLEKSGLPRSAFAGLAEVPAVVRVSHVGGETARGITVDIESDRKILRFVPDSSVETFKGTVAEDGNSLRIDVEQLRRKSVVSGTVLCEGIGGLRAVTRVDQGKVLDEAVGALSTQLARKLSFEDIDTLEPSVYGSEQHIDAVIEKLRDLLARERDPRRDEGKSSFPKFILLLAIPIALAVLGAFLIELPPRRRDDRRGMQAKRMGDKISHCKQLGAITVGAPGDKVCQMLGEPDKITTIQDEHGLVTTWSYVPPATRSFGRQPDAFVKLRDCKEITGHIQSCALGRNL